MLSPHLWTHHMYLLGQAWASATQIGTTRKRLYLRMYVWSAEHKIRIEIWVAIVTNQWQFWTELLWYTRGTECVLQNIAAPLCTQQSWKAYHINAKPFLSWDEKYSSLWHALSETCQSNCSIYRGHFSINSGLQKFRYQCFIFMQEKRFLARCYVVAKVYKVLYVWYSPSL